MNNVLEFPSVVECEPEWQERPVSAIAISNSRRRIRTTLVTPSAPWAPSPNR